MRTTLTLEPGVAERVGRRMKAEGASMKTIVNEALREGLHVLETTKGFKTGQVRCQAAQLRHSSGNRPGQME